MEYSITKIDYHFSVYYNFKTNKFDKQKYKTNQDHISEDKDAVLDIYDKIIELETSKEYGSAKYPSLRINDKIVSRTELKTASKLEVIKL